MYGRKVIGIRRSYAEQVGTQLSLDMIKVKDFDEAIDHLNKHKQAIVISKYLQLKQYLKSHPDHTIKSSSTFIASNEYAFAFRENDPLVRKINLALLIMQEKDEVMPICMRYISGKEGLGCMI